MSVIQNMMVSLYALGDVVHGMHSDSSPHRFMHRQLHTREEQVAVGREVVEQVS